MTDHEKYDEVLKALGEIIKEKDFQLRIKDYEISELKKKLEEAELQQGINEPT